MRESAARCWSWRTVREVISLTRVALPPSSSSISPHRVAVQPIRRCVRCGMSGALITQDDYEVILAVRTGRVLMVVAGWVCGDVCHEANDYVCGICLCCTARTHTYWDFCVA